MITKFAAKFTAPGEGRSYDIVGDRCTFKAVSEDTDGAYALIEDWIPPEAGTPPHVHRREDESFYILEGELTFGVDDRTITLRAGGFVYLPRGSRHWFKNTSHRPARALIRVTPGGFEKFLAEIGVPVTDLAVPPTPPTSAHIARLLATAPTYGIEIQAP
jgi:quercetin dioxygenase-like cupin family protein